VGGCPLPLDCQVETENLRTLSPVELGDPRAPEGAVARVVFFGYALDNKIEELGFITRPVWYHCPGGKKSKSFVEVRVIRIKSSIEGEVYRTRLSLEEIGPDCIGRIYYNLLFL
jgi:hypothetical protein